MTDLNVNARWVEKIRATTWPRPGFEPLFSQVQW